MAADSVAEFEVSMSNICERCGGQKTLYVKIDPVYNNGFISAVHAAMTPSTMKICLCPPIREKHDGKLTGGDTYEVYYDGAEKDAYICIQGTHNLSDHEVILEPKQALSLLAWLKQEQDTLERLAEE